MSEIDLIPGHYRRVQQLRRTFYRLAAVAVVGIVLVSAAKVGLVQGIRKKESELTRLKTVRTGLLSQMARVKDLEAERGRIDQQLSILSELRGGISAKHTLLAVDRALNAQVWFLSWTFHRAGQLVEEATEARNTGYFIVVPPEGSDETEKTWRLDTHMEIRAQAASHSALARFVRELVEQPEVEDVRIVSTRVHGQTAAQVVSFELAVVVKGRGSG